MPCQKFARNSATRSLVLPHNPNHRTPFTCAIVWAREALDGGVNARRIDGKDEVAGSIPAGGSHTKADQRKLRIWDRVEPAMLVLLAFGVVLDRRMPDGEPFPD